ncbi:MAG: hypothetical protein Fur0022_48510 [Anaerolineales bacterium]
MIGGEEVVISTNRGAQPAFHEFVQVGDMVYDALTGSKGMTTTEYFETFFYHLRDFGIDSFEEMVAKR